MPSLSSKNADAKTCVFWDVEDCPIPNGLDPGLVSENIKSALEKKGYNRRNVSIKVYGEENKSMDDANITFFPIGDKTERFLWMVKDLLLCLIDNRESNLVLMVISEDNADFASSLQSCQAKVNCNILLAQPDNAQRECRRCRSPLDGLIISDEWLWENLSSGGDPIPKKPESSSRA